MRDIDALLAQCKFPTLAHPYHQALEEAVRFILGHFDVLGIIAAGTIIRGIPNKSSDLDIFVIHRRDERQRLQRFFNTVPTELFVNPPHQIRRYFENEIDEGRPCTAHMFATGFVVLDGDAVVGELREKGKQIMASSPNPTEMRLTQLRYGVADYYENATDVIESDPQAAMLLMSDAVHYALLFRFWQANRWLPRHKALLSELAEIDPHLAQLGRRFYSETSLEERFRVAAEIMDGTIGVRGFFEWDSELETVPSDRPTTPDTN